MNQPERGNKSVQATLTGSDLGGENAVEHPRREESGAEQASLDQVSVEDALARPENDLQEPGTVVLPLLAEPTESGSTEYKPATCRTVIFIHDTAVRALIDTGAWRTMIQLSAYKRIVANANVKLLPCDLNFQSATGSEIIVHGRVVDLPINLGKYTFLADAIVCDLVGMEALIGMDFLNRHRAIVDIGRATVTLSGKECPVRERARGEMGVAVVKSSVSIPGGSMKQVDVHHDWPKAEATGLFEPGLTLGEFVDLPPQLVHPTRNGTAVWIENRSSDSIIVPERQILGQVTELCRVANKIHQYAIYDACNEYLSPDEGTTRSQLHITKSGFALRASDKSGERPDQSKEHVLWDEVLMADLGAIPVTQNTSSVSRANVVTRAMETDRVASLLNKENLAARRVTPRDGRVQGVAKAHGGFGGDTSRDDRVLVVSEAHNSFSRVQNKQEEQQDIGRDVSEVMMVRATAAPSEGKACKTRDAGTAVAARYGKLPDHLRVMMPPPETLTVSQATALVALVNRFQDVFIGPDGKVGFTDLTTHVIDTKDEKPSKIPPRRTGFAEKKVIEDTINDLLAEGKIRQSQSAWASPVVLVKKKDGSMRFCIDYRSLNDKTVKDAYPLPKIDEVLDQLAGSCYWSCLDLASGYWQVAMHPESVQKTAVCTHMGLFEWMVMPFGLCNAPAVFERLMEKVLCGLQWHGVLVYLDDVMAFGPTFTESLERLERVFERFREANLKLKPKKCFLMAKEVDYLGHHISKDGMTPLDSKVSAITHWKEPSDLTELRSFLGLTSYYRRFIANYSGIAVPLNELLKKGAQWEWTPARQKSFDGLRTALTRAPVLAFPKENCLFVLDTDASDFAIGAVLSQVQGGEEKVIAYYSKTLDGTQRRYCTTKRELLAIRASIEQWAHHLRMEEFVLRTDHQALKWVSTMKCNDRAMLNWASYVRTFKFEIEHRPGRLHSNADALSRAPRRKCGIDGCRDCQNPNTYHEDSSDDALRATYAVTRGQTRKADADKKKAEAAKTTRKQPARKVKNQATGRLSIREQDLHSDVKEKGGQDRGSKMPRGRGFRRQAARKAKRGISKSTPRGRLGKPDSHCTSKEDTSDVVKPESHCTSKEDTSDVGMFRTIDCLSLDDWIIAQKSDPAIRALNHLKLKAYKNEKPVMREQLSLSTEVKQLCYQWHSILKVRGCWSRVTIDPDTQQKIIQKLVPYKFRYAIFQALHGRPETGHFGYDRVYARARDRFFWIGMSVDIKDWLKTCDVCQKVKPGPGKGRYALIQEQAGAALERCAMDFSGPWPASREGNQYILVVQDYYTKWLELWALPDRKATTVAKCLVGFMQRYGGIQKLHSDQGREFESNLIKEVCAHWGVDKTRTQPYTPWSDGMVERANRTIHGLLRSLVEEMTDIWDKHIGTVMMSYNASVHTCTGYTPFKLMHSRCEDPELPLDLIFSSKVHRDPANECRQTYMENQKAIAARISSRVRERLGQQARVQARAYMRAGLKIRTYKVGDMVMVFQPSKAGRKLMFAWAGPFEVVKVAMDKYMVKIRTSTERTPGTQYVHCERLKPYKSFPIKDAGAHNSTLATGGN